ncbi:uncharacterized protein V1518DRAFT_398113 [Limtongia smithiae]|uniref:uncharacterized protein n=1 Tax=Limtongia smithiae TaxID=1125753 RepID=UPI0034CD9FA4
MDYGMALPPGMQQLQMRMMPQQQQPAMTGQVQMPMQPQGALMPLASMMMPPPLAPNQTGASKIPWAITRAEKKIFDDIFDAWDGLGRGFISGETAVEILGQSGLPQNDLMQIWTLADADDKGRLTKSEFSVAMHLVYRRLSGIPVPAQLPPELIPPSRRNISESLSAIKTMLKSDANQRRGNANPLEPQATGVSYLKAHSFREPATNVLKKDATVYKNNDDEATLYVSSARRRRNGGSTHDSGVSRGDTVSPALSVSSTGSMTKAESLESLRKLIHEKEILLAAIDAEDDLAFSDDQYLDSRDRDEADDLIRKIRHAQEDIDEFGGLASSGVAAEKAALRGQLQFLTDRLPVLVGRARGIASKIADAKLEIFRIRDAKAHPGAQIVGTGPGGRVTEADRVKARSLAILQARMAALTGNSAAAGAAANADDEHGAELRLAEESNKVAAEKDQNEKMIHDVEEGVRVVQHSLESSLRESRTDMKVERERQMFEDGVGTEDEVKDLILELQRRRGRTAGAPPRGNSSYSSLTSTRTSSAPISVTLQSTASSYSITAAAPITTMPATTSAPASFRTPEERSAWIKAEAERRMNERLAALGISRPAKGGSPAASAFSAPVPTASSAFSAPAPAGPATASAFVRQPPTAQPAASPARAYVAPAIASPVVRPASPVARESQAPVAPPPVLAPVVVAAPPPAPPAPVTTTAHKNTRNPFPVQDDSDDFYSYSPTKPTAPAASTYAQVSFSSAAPTPAQTSSSGTSSTSGYFSPATEDAAPRAAEDAASRAAVSFAPVAPSQPAEVPVSLPASVSVVAPALAPAPTPVIQRPTTTPTSSASAFPSQAALDAQRRHQRGAAADDDDGWGGEPSEDEDDGNDSDDGYGGGAGAPGGAKKPSPTDLASMLFGGGIPRAQTPAAVPVAVVPAAPPAPPMMTAGGPPPPPSPPMMMVGAPPPTPPPSGAPINRGALLGEITAGRALRKVQTVVKGEDNGVGRVL